tara:strand:- start:349 stop:1659 length:1311 start_codon:yes stop_codon:yes gene_type:complete
MTFDPTNVNEKIKRYLIQNPDLLRKNYAATAAMFGANYERVRAIARRLRKQLNLGHEASNAKTEEKTVFTENQNGATATCEDSKRVKSLDDLLKACKVDLNVWEVDKYDIGTYEVTGFDNNRKPITVTMYRTKAWLKKINPMLNIKKIREELVEDLTPLFGHIPKHNFNNDFYDDNPHLLEINATDLHLGKIGIKGDEYSLDIARERMLSSLEHLMQRSSGFFINQILFIVGNDFLNSDRDFPIPTTTKGTPQENTNSHIDIYRAGRKLIVECVNILSTMAKVHVCIVPGNHDRESMMHIGDALELFYESNDNVTVDNTDCMMKHYLYGKCLIINDHGNGPKTSDLPGIISQRYRNIWSDVDYVEVHRGHLHTNKSMKLQAVEELNGLTVRNLSSMSATDRWHDDKGYVGNIKRASAFVWSKYNGVQAKINYNVQV